MRLVEHLEARLGRITGGASERRGSAQIVRFEGGVFRDVCSWGTLGMSRHPVRGRGTNSYYMLEVFASTHASPEADSAVGKLVDWVAEQVANSGEMLTRGDISSLPGALAPRSRMTHVYAANPVYFDDDFLEVELDSSGARAGIIWLVPIGSAEAAFVQSAGWRSFEEGLEQEDPDLFDIYRDEVRFALPPN